MFALLKPAPESPRLHATRVDPDMAFANPTSHESSATSYQSIINPLVSPCLGGSIFTNAIVISNGVGQVEFFVTNTPPPQFYRIRMR